MPRPGDYLVKQRQSKNWYLQLIVPPDVRAANPSLPRKIMETMGTDNRDLARVKASPLIAQWKAQLAIARTALNPSVSQPKVAARWRQQPGTTVHNDDGTVSIVVGSEIVTLTKAFAEVRREPNFFLGVFESLTLTTPDQAPVRIERDMSDRTSITVTPVRKSPAFDLDNAVIENWQKMENIGDYFVSDAKKTLKLFHETTGKTMITADYDDGVALADALFASGNKSATVRKKIAFLRAAFNTTKINPKAFPQFKGLDNPFSKVVRKVDDDSLDKVMLDEADMKLIRDRMHQLGSNERTLLIWCAATGCRRGEPFQIDQECVIEAGYRSVRFGEKTPASDRIIPLPPALIALHPEPIKGPIFTDSEKNIGRNINRWLRKIGITDPAKTLHSTRHRAAYKLKRFQDSVRWECLGHENRTAPAEGYGAYPQDVLFEALASIGM